MLHLIMGSTASSVCIYMHVVGNKAKASDVFSTKDAGKERRKKMNLVLSSK